MPYVQYGTTVFTAVAVGAHGRVAVDSVITLSAPAKANILEFQAETTAGNYVRMTVNGDTPTTTLGFMFDTASGVQRVDTYPNAASFKFIGSAAGQFINYQWYMSQ